MDPNQLTLKTQEALHDAQTKALRYGHTELAADTSCALLEQPEGLVARLLARSGVDAGAPGGAGGASGTAAAGQRTGRRRGRIGITRSLAEVLHAAEQEAVRLHDDTSRSSTRCWR
jgi:ATP-dependent Clp protease ATP-binding subunit ClpB